MQGIVAQMTKPLRKTNTQKQILEINKIPFYFFKSAKLCCASCVIVHLSKEQNKQNKTFVFTKLKKGTKK